MPIIQSAKKKMRQDKRRTAARKPVRTRVKTATKAVRKNPTEKNLKEAFSVLDTATKKHVIHKNKASRLKSRLSKMIKK